MRKGVIYLPYTVMPFLVITAVKTPEIEEKYLVGATLIIIHLLFELCSDEASHFISSSKAPLFFPQKGPDSGQSRFKISFMHPPLLHGADSG